MLIVSIFSMSRFCRYQHVICNFHINMLPFVCPFAFFQFVKLISPSLTIFSQALHVLTFYCWWPCRYFCCCRASKYSCSDFLYILSFLVSSYFFAAIFHVHLGHWVRGFDNNVAFNFLCDVIFHTVLPF